MADPRTTVERALAGAEVRPITLDAFHARRERKARNQRIAAGVLGISVALAVGLVASRLVDGDGDGDGDRTAGPPARNGSIAFQGDRGLFVSGPDGSGSHAAIRRVPDPPGACLSDRAHACAYRGMTWSPDGTQLAFVFGEMSAALLGDMSIYVMDAATEEVRLLARCPARAGDPRGDCDNGNRLSWSPDGSRLAVSSGSDLFVVDPRSGALTRITGCPTCSYQGVARYPAWSPTGDLIAFSGVASLDAVRSDGSGWRTIVGRSEASLDELNGTRSDWSPDGRRLAFFGDDGLYVVNADGSGLRPLVNHHPSITTGGATWSPDSRRILYLKTPGGRDDFRAEVRAVDLAAGDELVLYRSGCCIDDWGTPVYSPDGTRIAFSLGVDDGFFVYVMDADGSDVRRLEGYGPPAWQPLPR